MPHPHARDASRDNRHMEVLADAVSRTPDVRRGRTSASSGSSHISVIRYHARPACGVQHVQKTETRHDSAVHDTREHVSPRLHATLGVTTDTVDETHVARAHRSQVSQTTRNGRAAPCSRTALHHAHRPPAGVAAARKRALVVYSTSQHAFIHLLIISLLFAFPLHINVAIRLPPSETPQTRRTGCSARPMQGARRRARRCSREQSRLPPHELGPSAGRRGQR
jgi:hypothetical protein